MARSIQTAALPSAADPQAATERPSTRTLQAVDISAQPTIYAQDPPLYANQSAVYAAPQGPLYGVPGYNQPVASLPAPQVYQTFPSSSVLPPISHLVAVSSPVYLPTAYSPPLASFPASATLPSGFTYTAAPSPLGNSPVSPAATPWPR